MNKFEFLSMDTIDDKGEATGDNLSDGAHWRSITGFNLRLGQTLSDAGGDDLLEVVTKTLPGA